MESRIFEYVNNLINTNFSNFTNNLFYNSNKKVVSKDYDYVQFFHHDLIKNITINRPHDDGKILIDVMNKRAERFMNIINNENNKVIFLTIIHHSTLINKKGLDKKLYKDMINFDTNLNIKCNFKVLVYLYNDNEDYNLIIPNELNNLKNFIFDKYIRNRFVDNIYGDRKDFKQLLEKKNLL